MTVALLLATMWKRWYVCVAGLVILILALSYAALRPGVYWSQIDVVFLAPQSIRYPNSIETTSQSLIAMAGLIERDLNKTSRPPRTASSSVTLVNEGIREGSSIRLPNSGGQWANNFDRAVLDVQVVGSSPQVVQRKLRTLVDGIDAKLEQVQREAGVDPQNRIITSSAPSAAALFYFDGRKTRAYAALLFLGGIFIPAGAVGFDRIASRPNSSPSKLREAIA